MSSLALAYYLIINLATFVVYGWDKSSARQGRWRTQESVLLTLSIFGGAFGGLLAMTLLHHKTRKMVFWVVNLVGCAIHLYLIVFDFRG
ncbi:MAG: DUF1294 domain-containing protein [Chloroflexi bacterium]|nr:MAG: DUF1294 domain-containing protein [Chloroflexota bacterium]